MRKMNGEERVNFKTNMGEYIISTVKQQFFVGPLFSLPSGFKVYFKTTTLRICDLCVKDSYENSVNMYLYINTDLHICTQCVP